MLKSDAFAIAIAAVVDTNRNGEFLNVTELADVMGTLCDARSTALYCEQRDEEAAKAKAEQEAADHVES